MCFETGTLKIHNTTYERVSNVSYSAAMPGGAQFSATIEMKSSEAIPQEEQHLAYLIDQSDRAVFSSSQHKGFGGPVKSVSCSQQKDPCIVSVTAIDYTKWTDDQQIIDYDSVAIQSVQANALGILTEAGLYNTGETIDNLNVTVLETTPVTLRFVADPGSTAHAALDKLAGQAGYYWFVKSSFLNPASITGVPATIYFVQFGYTGAGAPIDEIYVETDDLDTLEYNDPAGRWQNLTIQREYRGFSRVIVASNPEAARAGVTDPIFDERDQTCPAGSIDRDFDLLPSTIAVSEASVVTDTETIPITVRQAPYAIGEDLTLVTEDAVLDYTDPQTRKIRLTKDLKDFPVSTTPSFITLHTKEKRANYYGIAIDTALESEYLAKNKCGTGHKLKIIFNPNLSSNTEAQAQAEQVLSARPFAVSQFEFTTDYDAPSGWSYGDQWVRLRFPRWGVDVTLPVQAISINPILNPEAEESNGLLRYRITCRLIERLTVQGLAQAAIDLATTAITPTPAPVEPPEPPDPEPACTIDTIAGTGSSGDTGEGGPGASAQIDPGPNNAIAIKSNSDVYFLDYGNNKVKYIDSAGDIHTFYDFGPGSNNFFLGNEIIFDSDDNLLLTGEVGPLSPPENISNYNSPLYKITASGVLSVAAGVFGDGDNGDGGNANAAKMYGAKLIALDNTGNKYIYHEPFDTSIYNYRIRIINTSNIINTFAGGGVSAFGEGILKTNIDFTLFRILSMDIDNDGNLYFSTNSATRKIYIIKASDNKIYTFAGTGTKAETSPGSGVWDEDGGDNGDRLDARLGSDIHLTINRETNKLIFCESEPYTDPGFVSLIREIDLSTSVITRTAGVGPISFGGDGGDPLDAYLQLPRGITAKNNTTAFIDYNNNRIRKITCPE
jgi:hypothetical protein